MGAPASCSAGAEGTGEEHAVVVRGNIDAAIAMTDTERRMTRTITVRADRINDDVHFAA
jgi:hypothetical protein